MKQQKSKGSRESRAEEGHGGRNQLRVEIELQKAVEKEEQSVEAMSSRQRKSRRKTEFKDSTLGM